MGENDRPVRTAQTYRAFAGEACGRSPRYEELALAVAGDPVILEFLITLPAAKRQPNLLFAAASYLLGEAPDLAALHALISHRPADLTGTMLARRTQTNEPARCATLLPALALLPQPLALLEVGASAGLTLLPDKYSYDYAGHRVTGADPLAPVLACQPRGPVPLPEQVPEVAWRTGLDLNPLDVASDAPPSSSATRPSSTTSAARSASSSPPLSRDSAWSGWPMKDKASCPAAPCRKPARMALS